MWLAIIFASAIGVLMALFISFSKSRREARNREVIRRYYSNVVDGRAHMKNKELLNELVHNDVVFHRPGRSIVGIYDVHRFLGDDSEKLFRMMKTAIQDISSFGNKVVVRILHHVVTASQATLQTRLGKVTLPDEKSLSWEALSLFELKDGLITRQWTFLDGKWFNFGF